VEEVQKAVAPPISRLPAERPQRLNRRDSGALNLRLDVRIAIGMVMEYVDYTNVDALATLRGCAYSHSRTLDEVSQDLLGHRLSAADIVDP
jgi:hypothetical protein